jgi:hypothetical protein
VYAQVDAPPSQSEWEDYERLMGEILSAAFGSEGFDFHLSQGTGEPPDESFELLMSQAQFEALAKQFAPWRLDAGR